ncbi:MAG: RHS repeat protein, partial [bacterium]|nr:RHS repeat protein [bacterium]
LFKKTETEKNPDPDEEDEVHITRFEYNAFGKIQKTTVVVDGTEANDLITTYLYTPKGELQTITDAEGNITEFVYDDFGRKTIQKKYLANKEVVQTNYSYYPNNKLWTVSDAKGNTSTYEYDEQDRLKKVIYPDTSFLGYAYTTENIDGEVVKVVTETQRNGTAVKTVYDKGGRVKNRDITRAGNVEGMTFETYGYDNLNRVT